MRISVVCLSFLLCLQHFQARAQNGATIFDHTAIYVHNLDSSVHFYTSLFHFDTLPHPPAPLKYQWLNIGDHIALHLVEGLKDTVSLPFMLHNCFSVASLPAFITLLDKLAIPYYSGPERIRDIRHRPDGVNQIFIKDPDKYWVEINDARHP